MALAVLLNEHWDNAMVIPGDTPEHALQKAEAYARQCWAEWAEDTSTEAWEEYCEDGPFTWLPANAPFGTGE